MNIFFFLVLIRMNSVTSSANANSITSITHGCRLPPCCGSDGSSQQIGGLQVTGSGGWLWRGFVRSVSKRWEKDRREGGIERRREERTHSQAEPESAVKREESLHIRWGAFTGSPSIARSRFGIHTTRYGLAWDTYSTITLSKNMSDSWHFIYGMLFKMSGLKKNSN